MTLLDVQHVKKSIKHVSKEIRLKPLKISILRLRKVTMLQSWVSPAQENQPCLISLPYLINQQQGVSI